jgi:hypothetical protein
MVQSSHIPLLSQAEPWYQPFQELNHCALWTPLGLPCYEHRRWILVMLLDRHIYPSSSTIHCQDHFRAWWAKVFLRVDIPYNHIHYAAPSHKPRRSICASGGSWPILLDRTFLFRLDHSQFCEQRVSYPYARQRSRHSESLLPGIESSSTSKGRSSNTEPTWHNHLFHPLSGHH